MKRPSTLASLVPSAPAAGVPMGRLALPHASPATLAWDRESVCLACHRVVPDGEGVYHADLRALTCLRDCYDVVADLSRLRDRSARGRWRPVRVVISLANGARCPECQSRSTP